MINYYKFLKEKKYSDSTIKNYNNGIENISKNLNLKLWEMTYAELEYSHRVIFKNNKWFIEFDEKWKGVLTSSVKRLLEYKNTIVLI